MKCRKCRGDVPDGGKFCPFCGARQGVSQNPKRRGNGQGSVYQLQNKTWIAVKVLKYELSEDGQRTRKQTISKSGFRTKKEALDYLPKLTAAEKKVTTKTWLQLYDEWFPTHKAGKSTMGCYQAAKAYFRPVWNMRMNEITIDDLQDCMDDCPKGKRTQENMKALCGLVYKYAIPRFQAVLNMGEFLRVNGDGSDGKNALPEGAVEKLRDALGVVPYADYVYCQCYLGFRPSELLALDASNYDRKHKAFVGGAKTDAGKDRVVTISPKIQPIIDRLMMDKIGGQVFCAKDGKRLEIRAYREAFYKVLDAIGVENPIVEKGGVKYRTYTPHCCRHTFATLMKRVQGADKDKLELIGHTSTAMLRHYQDVDFEDLRKITDAI